MQLTNVEDIYPLSPMQEGMLFHSLYDPQSEVYFEQIAFTLRGNLNVAAFQRAWQQVIARHPILRTLFLWEQLDSPLQVVRQQVALPWTALDWRHVPASEHADRLQDFVRSDRAQGFDLSQAPLLRLSLIHLSENTFHFTWSFHHILLDGWSIATVFGEVFACYRAIRQEQTLSLAASRPYSDYIAWLQQQDLGQAETYWRETLRGFTTPTLLGVDLIPGRESKKPDYRDHTFHLPATTSAALQTLARQQQLTLNTLVQSAWALLLAHYSGQQDVVFGVTVSGRPAALAGVESMVGLFINTLPLRTQVNSQQQLLPWLHALQAGQAEARQFDYTPLVQIQNWSEIPRGHALFESLLVFENYPIDAALEQSGSLEIDHTQGEEWTNYPLTITVLPENDITMRFGYMTNRFEEATIRRLASHLQTLLEGMLAHPQQRLVGIPFLTQAERQQLLFDWNPSTSYAPAPSIPALFEAQVERAPDAIALIFEEEQLSYGALNARANQLAHHLQRLGVGAETLVGLCLERSLDMLVGILGVLKAGAAYVPLDPSSPPGRLAFLLADAQPSVLLTQSRLSDRVMLQHGSALCLDTDWPAMRTEPTSNLASSVNPNTLAYVIYTSGSTGQPKGVPVSHAQVTRLFAATDSSCHFNQDDSWTLFHSYAFDFSVWEIWGALLYGGRLVVVPFWQSRSPASFAALLQSQSITVLNQTPSAFRQLSSTEEASPATAYLRLVIFGGEVLDPRSLQPWFERHGDRSPQLVNMYGITETTIHVTTYALSLADAQRAGSSPIGRPLADLQVYILDAHMQPTPIGVVGELYVGGAGLSRGYLHRPELTAERFVPHPFSQQPGARLYKTGDLARFLPDGQLAYLGRNDSQVKIRGYRIELGEIEAALAQHPSVGEAVVVAREDQPGDKRLVAYVVARPQASFTSSDLRRLLQSSLPDYMLPASFVSLEALPLTSNGKLDLRALPAPENSRPSLDKAYVAPRTSVEHLLADIWASVLKLKQVGIHDNFFEVGGDSILSIQIVARATAAGLPLTPRHLFQHQSIAQLALVVGEAPAVQTTQDLVLGPLPLTPIQHWFLALNLPDPHHWNQVLLLRGPQSLDPTLLQQAVQSLLIQHDILRLRAQHETVGWSLTIAAPLDDVPFSSIDLSTLPEAQRKPALETAAAHLQASLNVTDGPVLRVALFDMGPQQPSRLLLIIHHLAVDIVSWSILLEDIQTAYQQLRQGHLPTLPPKTTSYQRWSERLSEYAQSLEVRSHLAFWLNQPWADVHPLPLDTHSSPDVNSEASARTLTVTLSPAETQALLSEVPAAYHTHINDVLLTALVQAFARWTGQAALLLHLEGHGREDMLDGVDLARTVGWFTALAPVVLSIAESQEPGAALKSIKDQLRRVPQHGLSFGLLRYLSQDTSIIKQLAALPQPAVSFNYSGRSVSSTVEDGLFMLAAEDVGAAHSPRGQRPHLLDINSGILNDQLFIEWTYSDTMHHSATIEKLGHFYLEALHTLIRHCQSPEAGGYTPSDFPDTRLTQTALDTLVSTLSEATTTDEVGRHAPNIEAIYPLSPMQEGMLFHRLYDPQSEIYFEQLACNIHGDLNVPAFQHAWQHVIARHPILRTLFLWEHLDTPLQVVCPQVALPWSALDWRHLSTAEQQQHLQDFLRTDRAQGLDLSHAPLLRLHLIRLSEDTFHFIWSFHHLLLDGWSVTTVLSEVFACYEAARQQQTLQLPPARPYRDYIRWLQQQDLVQAEAFWRETLRGFSSPTPFGVDQVASRTGETAPDYHDQVFHISHTTTAALQTLARQHQLTLNTLVQGAWALLLSHYSGQHDVVFGTIVSGRSPALANAEAMVGLFINTLPLRTQIDPRQHLLPWLQALQAQQVEARQYEYTPLVQLQGWSEVPRGHALFESLFVFENYPVAASLEQEQSVEVDNPLMVEWTNYPLTIVVVPGASLVLRISYMGSRFEAATIQRLAAHFQTLLRGMVAQPDQPLGTLPLLTASERQQLLLAWNTPTVFAPTPCLHTLFEAQVARTPDAIALVFEEQQLSYGALNARANQLARHLLALTTPAGEPLLAPDTCVGLCLERSLELLIGLLAILKAGAAYLPLDPAAPTERLSFLLADAQAPVLLTEQKLAARLPPQHATLLCLDRDWPTIAEQHADNPAMALHAQQLAYVIYTSGSTGQPKGVLVSHAQVSRLFAATAAAFHFDARDSWTLFHSVAFDFSVWELWGALLYGGRLVVVPFWQSRSPDRFAALLQSQAITVLNQTPSAFAQLSSAEAASATGATPHLRLVIFGGEALDPHSLQPWFERHGDRCPQLVNMYGITETTVHVTAHALTAVDAQRAGTSPIGRPLADGQVYILNEQMQPVPIGVAGELYVGGAGLSRGYLHHPELTAERFVPHPFSQQPGERLYQTGDLARFLPDGQLVYLGRNDSQVKIRGYRIELGEIEAVLHQHPAVRAAAVVAREDVAGDKRLMAYVVADQEQSDVGGELRRFMQQRLPDYMLPSTFMVLETFPLTANGKVDRRALPQPDQTTSRSESEYVAPRTASEETLASIWEQVLRQERVGVHDNFFELGGHSLLATQIIVRIRQAFQVELPLRNLFLTPTVADIAEQIEAVRQTRQGPRLPSIKRLSRTIS